MIIGTWVSSDGTILDITESNDSGGTMSGTITASVDGQALVLDVSGTYRITDNVSLGVTLEFTGGQTGAPNIREAWAGSALQPAGGPPPEWNLCGARGVTGDGDNADDLVLLQGIFKLT